MVIPNYKNGSIVNLMSSIQTSLGDRNEYAPLKNLDLKLFKESKNIILMVIDGLGYEYLLKNKKKTFFEDKSITRITSAFPSTTASGITTFMTGVAPQQHGITGWFMYMKELNSVVKPLPSSFRGSDEKFSELGLNSKEIYDQNNIFSKLKIRSYVILEKSLLDSDYNSILNKDAKVIKYQDTNLNSFFKETRKIVSSNNKRKFIYTYWPHFDKIFHHKGEESKELTRHFKMIEKKISTFTKSLKGTNTTLIITADHGLIDTKTILLDNHPKLKETLSLPLCGEPRLVYCYVKPSKKKEFERYIKTEMSRYCSLHKSSDLVRKNYFGLFKSHKHLSGRIGDYILMMKENYAIKDFVNGEKRKIKKASHGGISAKEMYVPLIVINYI